MNQIDLCDNKIKGEDLAKLLIYKNLIKLKVSNNLISNLDELNVLVNKN